MAIKHQKKMSTILNFVFILNFVVKIGKKLYPQTLLEEYKYAVKKKNIINAISKELNLDESDESEEENNEN